MEGLFDSLLLLLTALWQVVVGIFVVLRPLLPLTAWVAFWLFAVDWAKLRRVILDGGWVGLVLIAFVIVLVWGTVAPPPDGYHHVLQLKLSNYFGKLVYVSGLACIMLLCGAVQLGGCCAGCAQIDEPAAESDVHEHAH